MATRLDIFRSASAFALDTVAEKHPHKIATAALARFGTEQLSPDDWELWDSQQREVRNRLQLMATQKAPSIEAEDKAAAEEALKAKRESMAAPKAPMTPAEASAAVKKGLN
jgi:hypothetical protein